MRGAVRRRTVVVACVACVALAAALVAQACAREPKLYRRDAVAAAGDSPWLKCHMSDGSLVLLRDWKFEGDAVSGSGERYDRARSKVADRPMRVPLSDVVLFETSEWDVARNVPTIAVLVIAGVASAVLAGYCLANPKSCFGSCPTFYVRDDAGRAGPGPDGAPAAGVAADGTPAGFALQAEGFSRSIARRLEETDLDAMPRAAAGPDGFVDVLMRNEAYETHAVRHVDVLAVPRPDGADVWATRSRTFLALGAARAAVACSGPGGDCAAALARDDGAEFTPPADATDLAARTEVVARFDAPGARDVGLALTVRNSLLTTFLLYHLLALHGRSAGELVAELERGDLWLLLRLQEIARLLGDVGVAWRHEGEVAWRPAGRVEYSGPIAHEREVVPFRVDDPARPVEVRLSFGAGGWRLDAAALRPVVARDLEPVRLAPTEARRAPDEAPDAGALAALLDPERHLVTTPGDDWYLRFRAPEEGPHAFFLESRGYYYEWMRFQWLKEENLAAARALLRDPAAGLRALAPAYKEMEGKMEAVFEASRFRKP